MNVFYIINCFSSSVSLLSLSSSHESISGGTALEKQYQSAFHRRRKLSFIDENEEIYIPWSTLVDFAKSSKSQYFFKRNEFHNNY